VTLILFPYQPSAPTTVDTEFAAEFAAARATGFATAFYDHRATLAGDVAAAATGLPAAGDGSALILRGWMLPGEQYASLYNELTRRGWRPVTSPAAYEETHYLPNAYRWIEGETARSAWIEGDDVDAAWRLYQDFRQSDAVIKDWVKSAKRRWRDGCFLPAETSEARFHEIFRVFRQERGRLFNRGVVLREYMPIVTHGLDMRGLPIVEETRLFFWKGELLVAPIGQAPSPLEELDCWTKIARSFQSSFLTIDVAYLTDHRWRIVEVGDGGVSGLPMGMLAETFYGNLWNKMRETPSRPADA
jgi:hypothetical protein